MDRVFRITFFTKIGVTSWRSSEKKFCDSEKELKNLTRKAKMTTNRRNKSPYRECCFVLEEFIGNSWTVLEEYPIEETNEKTETKEAKQ